MGRIIRGTGDAKRVILKKAPGGERKIRCPKCQGLAVPALSRNGTKVLRCSTCSTEFTSTKL